MIRQILNTWKSFLPKRAIVMVRHAPAATQALENLSQFPQETKALTQPSATPLFSISTPEKMSQPYIPASAASDVTAPMTTSPIFTTAAAAVTLNAPASNLFPAASQAFNQPPRQPATHPQVALSPQQAQEALLQIGADLQGCTRCKLCQKRTHIVVGEGNPRARLVFVGEGPGEQEDLQGRPFVGNAGQLLDRMIQAIGLDRNQVYIANVVKCRPPGNRNPEPDEIQSCSPFLHRQLDVIQPEVVVALGKFAAQTLLQTEERITQLRGKFRTYRGIKLMPTFHPSYLLRNPSAKREAWIDLQAVAKELGIQIPKR